MLRSCCHKIKAETNLVSMSQPQPHYFSFIIVRIFNQRTCSRGLIKSCWFQYYEIILCLVSKGCTRWHSNWQTCVPICFKQTKFQCGKLRIILHIHPNGIIFRIWLLWKRWIFDLRIFLRMVVAYTGVYIPCILFAYLLFCRFFRRKFTAYSTTIYAS